MITDRADVSDHPRSLHNPPAPPNPYGRVCASAGGTWSGMLPRTGRTGIDSPLCLPAVVLAAVAVFSALHFPPNVPR